MELKLARLRATVESFADLIAGLQPAEVAPAAWGPREVLVHLVFWHETLVTTIAALLDGQQPHLPAGTFAELNAAAVRQHADVPPAELIDRFRKAQTRLEQLAQAAAIRPPAIPVKAGSKPRSFDDLLVEVEAHIRNHEVDVRRQLKQRRAPR